MFLEDIEQIVKIVKRTGFAIFALPSAADVAAVKVPHAIVMEPNEKGHIGIEEVRQIEELTRTKQGADLVILVREADKLGEAAANAFLKLLEEPGENVHFGFLTARPATLLPTIRSRAQNYVLRDVRKIDDAPELDEKLKDLAKRLIAAKPAELPTVVAEIAKDKVDARGKALAVVDAAIQLLYKSYFKTGNEKFLGTLEKLLAAQAALAANGHIKLQLIANMVQ